MAERDRMRSRANGSLFVVLSIVAGACTGAEAVSPGGGVVPVLVETLAEDPGANCPSGGTLIQVGYDRDGDGSLAAAEVSSHSYVCSGASASGADGSNGSDGADGRDGSVGANGDDGVDGSDGENGTDGTDGKDGQNGVNGQNGTDGQDGERGVDSLVRTDFESPGLNCLHGGIEVQFGPDSDRSGALDDAEVTTTNYVCNGAAGLNGGADGLSSLVRTVLEAPGQHCQAGGTRIEMGIDDNKSTVLDPSEVDSVSFACPRRRDRDRSAAAPSIRLGARHRDRASSRRDRRWPQLRPRSTARHLAGRNAHRRDLDRGRRSIQCRVDQGGSGRQHLRNALRALSARRNDATRRPAGT